MTSSYGLETRAVLGAAAADVDTDSRGLGVGDAGRLSVGLSVGGAGQEATRPGCGEEATRACAASEDARPAPAEGGATVGAWESMAGLRDAVAGVLAALGRVAARGDTGRGDTGRGDTGRGDTGRGASAGVSAEPSRADAAGLSAHDAADLSGHGGANGSWRSLAEGIRDAVRLLPSEELGALFGAIARARAGLEGLSVAVLVEAADRGVVSESVSVDVAGWARDQALSAGTGVPPAQAGALRAITDLALAVPGGSGSPLAAGGRRSPDFGPLVDAVVAGEVPVASARSLAAHLDVMSNKIPAPVWRTAADELVAWAAEGAAPTDVRRARDRITAEYGTEAFEDEQKVAHRHRELTGWRPDHTGGWSCRLTTDNAGRAALDAAFDALAGPRPTTVLDEETGREITVADGRTPGQRRHDALLELVRVVATNPALTPAGRAAVGAAVGASAATGAAAKARLTITLDWTALRHDLLQRRPELGPELPADNLHSAPEQGHRAGQVPGRHPTPIDAHGTPLSWATVRQEACLAGLIPAVLAGPSAILDFGRERRLASAAQIAALHLRDRGCTFSGCTRPPAWCDAHHLDEWASDSGPTDLDNLALLCSRHHTVVHQRGLRGRLQDGGVRWTTRAASDIAEGWP